MTGTTARDTAPEGAGPSDPGSSAGSTPTITPPVPLEAGVWRTGALLAGIAGLFLALHEISVLSDGFLTATGDHASFNSLSRCIVGSSCDGWVQGLADEQMRPWLRLLFLYLVLDAVYVVAYAAALWLLVVRHSHRRGPLRGALCVLVAAEVVEDLGQLWLGIQRREDAVSDALLTEVEVATTVKWVMASVLMACMVLKVCAWLFRSPGPEAVSDGSKPTWRRAHLVWSALVIQRFSLILFLPVAILAIMPLDKLNNMFGQLPDVQRSWLDSWAGLWFAVAAGAAHLAAVFAMFVLGRIRSDYAARRDAIGGEWPYYEVDKQRTPRPAQRRLWMIAPALLLVLALIVTLLTDGVVQWWRLAVFCVVPLLVIGSSEVTARAEMPSLPVRDARWPRFVMGLGDLLAVSAISLAGLGAIRALTPVVALQAADLLGSDVALGAWLPTAALAVGVAILIGAWLAAPGFLDDLDKRARDEPGPTTEPAQAGDDAPGGAHRWRRLVQAWARGGAAVGTLSRLNARFLFISKPAHRSGSAKPRRKATAGLKLGRAISRRQNAGSFLLAG